MSKQATEQTSARPRKKQRSRPQGWGDLVENIRARTKNGTRVVFYDPFIAYHCTATATGSLYPLFLDMSLARSLGVKLPLPGNFHVIEHMNYLQLLGQQGKDAQEICFALDGGIDADPSSETKTGNFLSVAFRGSEAEVASLSREEFLARVPDLIIPSRPIGALFSVLYELMDPLPRELVDLVVSYVVLEEDKKYPQNALIFDCE